MATTTTLRIKSPESLAQLSDLARSTTSPKAFANFLVKWLDKIQAGGLPGNVSISVQLGGTVGVQASATATCASVIATDTIVVGGTTLTAVANSATPTSAQFRIGTGGGATQNAQCAANIASAINANSTISKLVSATSSAAVVTITALAAGIVGNKITLTATGGTITCTGSGNLASGAGDDVATVTYTYA